jgi:hypothetical protein
MKKGVGTLHINSVINQNFLPEMRILFDEVLMNWVILIGLCPSISCSLSAEALGFLFKKILKKTGNILYGKRKRNI